MAPKRKKEIKPQQAKPDVVVKTIGKRRGRPPKNKTSGAFDDLSILKIPDIMAELNNPEIVKQTEEEIQLRQWVKGEHDTIPQKYQGQHSSASRGRTRKLLQQIINDKSWEIFRNQQFLDSCCEYLFCKERLEKMSDIMREQAYEKALKNQVLAMETLKGLYSITESKNAEQVDINDPKSLMLRMVMAMSDSATEDFVKIKQTELIQENEEPIDAEIVKTSD